MIGKIEITVSLPNCNGCTVAEVKTAYADITEQITEAISDVLYNTPSSFTEEPLMKICREAIRRVCAQ